MTFSFNSNYSGYSRYSNYPRGRQKSPANTQTNSGFPKKANVDFSKLTGNVDGYFGVPTPCSQSGTQIDGGSKSPSNDGGIEFVDDQEMAVILDDGTVIEGGVPADDEVEIAVVTDDGTVTDEPDYKEPETKKPSSTSKPSSGGKSGVSNTVNLLM